MSPHLAYCLDSMENKVLELLTYKLRKAKEGRKGVWGGQEFHNGLSLARSSSQAPKTDGSNLKGIKWYNIELKQLIMWE